MKSKRLILALALLCLLAVVEFTLGRHRAAEGYILFVNKGQLPIENLTVSFDGRTHSIERIPEGAESGLYVGSKSKGPLKVAYKSKDTSLGGFNIPEYDPVSLAADGQRLVLVVDGAQIMRYQEDKQGAGLSWDRIKQALAPYW